LGTVLVAALTYFGVRLIVQGDTEQAMANADRILAFERSIGIDVESNVQSVVLDHRPLEVLGNLSYVWLHWPLLIAVMLVLYRRDRAGYVRLRRALIASGAVGLVLFWAVPTAPPRFMPGFEGTVSDDARRHFIHYPLEWANRYAAFPSFHVGWTLVACLALSASMSGRARSVALVPALLVGLAVVTTGNHYIVDAVVGGLIALGAYALAVPRHRSADEHSAATARSRFTRFDLISSAIRRAGR
jgi:membrane-associated phospholipid phosphatase